MKTEIKDVRQKILNAIAIHDKIPRDILSIPFRDKETGAEMHYQVKNDTLFISVHQTDDIQDWVTNIKTDFEKAAGKLLIEIYAKIILDKLPKFTKVKIEGYSMGGAIAPFLGEKLYNCGLDSVFKLDEKIVVVGFDAPEYTRRRISNNIEIINVENGNDLVNKIPFWLHKSGITVKVGEKRLFWKLGVKFRYDKNKTGMYKYFNIPEHEWKNIVKACYEYDLWNMEMYGK